MDLMTSARFKKNYAKKGSHGEKQGESVSSVARRCTHGSTISKRSTKEQALAAYPPLVGIPRKTSSAQQRSLLPRAGESLADAQRRWKRNDKKAETSRMRYARRKQEKDTHLYICV